MIIKRLALVLCLVAVSNALSLTPDIPTNIYALFFLFCFLSFFLKGKIQLYLPLTIFILGCGLSILLNDIPFYFNSELRFFSFLIVFSCIGPLFYNEQLAKFRIALFNYATFFVLCIVVLSILGRFTGIYPGLDSAGLFKGISVHSMLLGPLASIALIFSIWKILQLKNNLKIKKKYILIACVSFLCILLASSRGALIGALIGLMVFMARYYKARMTSFIKLFLTLLLFTICTYSFWSSYADGMKHKNLTTDEKGGLTSSRSELWEFRYQEFLERPIYGIGFASAKYGIINTSNGRVEPGTAWGAIFAQIGLLGGLSFLFMVLYYFSYLYKTNDKFNYNPLFLGILTFFIAHWFAEGYMLGSGDFLFFYAWLLLGVIDIYKKNPIHFSKVPLMDKFFFE